MNILDLLKEDKIESNKVATTYGGEYAGKCPGCKGKDRFRCWPNQGDEGGTWWCRQCGKGGDLVKYLTEFRGLSYQDACRFLGKSPLSNRLIRGGLAAGYQYAWEPKSPQEAPSDKWQSKADKIITWSEDYLWRDYCINLQTWLSDERGLKDKTIKRVRLGWLPKDIYLERESWDLPEKLKESGKVKKLWLPAGLVIPYTYNGGIQRIRIRLHEPRDNIKYYIVPGSTTNPMNIGDGKIVVIVESELDGILVHQEAKDLVGVIALGSAEIKPDTETFKILNNAEKILISLDSDETSARASQSWWLKQFSNAIRWPTPYGKDPTEAYQKGLNIRDWVMAGISYKNDKQKVIDKTPVTASIKDFNIISDDNSLKESLNTLKDSKAFVVNVITTGTDPFKDNIRLIQLAGPDLPIISIDLKKCIKKQRVF